MGGAPNRNGKVRNGIDHLGTEMIRDGEAKYRMVMWALIWSGNH